MNFSPLRGNRHIAILICIFLRISDDEHISLVDSMYVIKEAITFYLNNVCQSQISVIWTQKSNHNKSLKLQRRSLRGGIIGLDLFGVEGAGGPHLVMYKASSWLSGPGSLLIGLRASYVGLAIRVCTKQAPDPLCYLLGPWAYFLIVNFMKTIAISEYSWSCSKWR